jgi:hypothetical protein
MLLMSIRFDTLNDVSEVHLEAKWSPMDTNPGIQERSITVSCVQSDRHKLPMVVTRVSGVRSNVLSTDALLKKADGMAEISRRPDTSHT